MKRLACVIASAALLGCSSCPAPTSTASAVGDSIVLDAAMAEGKHAISIHAPEQDCGCSWCGDPMLSLTFTGTVAWTSPPGATAHPVVRVTLAPQFKGSPRDTLDPPLPVDVVLTPDAPSRKPTLTATHLCPEGEACDVDYTLTVSRLDPAPLGPITAVWTVEASFPSKPDGSLGVTVTR